MILWKRIALVGGFTLTFAFVMMWVYSEIIKKALGL
jgi:hypothetical protein